MSLSKLFKLLLLPLIGILWYILYNQCLYHGVKWVGYDKSPLLLLALAIAIPTYVIIKSSKTNVPIITNPKWHSWLLMALSLVAVWSVIDPVMQTFIQNPMPTKNSDVLPQLTWQYERFFAGQQPYVPATTLHYAPFPVYMPLHWLPLGIGDLLGIDLRWSGIILFAMAYLCAAWVLGKMKIPLLWKVILIWLPMTIIWYPLDRRIEDINSVLETVVAAYYLLLVAGLLSKKEWMIVGGILGGLLTRYTILFWLPAAFLIVYQEEGSRKALRIAFIAIGGVVILYVIPFLLRDPTIFEQGLAYHNNCAILDWQSMDGGNIPWIVTEGTSYIQYYHRFINSDSPQQNVFILRSIQLGLMLLLNVFAFVGYRRLRGRVDIYPYLLSFLAIVIIAFYATSPLAFGYYWFCVTMLMWGCLVAAIGLNLNSR